MANIFDSLISSLNTKTTNVMVDVGTQVVGALASCALSEGAASVLLGEERKRANAAIAKAKKSGSESDSNEAEKLRRSYNFKASFVGGACAGFTSIMAGQAGNYIKETINSNEKSSNPENSGLFISNLL